MTAQERYGRAKQELRAATRELRRALLAAEIEKVYRGRKQFEATDGGLPYALLKRRWPGILHLVRPKTIRYHDEGEWLEGVPLREPAVTLGLEEIEVRESDGRIKQAKTSGPLIVLPGRT